MKNTPTKTATKQAAPPPPPAKTAAKQASKALALVSNKQLAGLEDLLVEDAGSGMENMDRNDLAIPRVSIIQSTSDQIVKSHASFIAGATPGDIFDNIDQTIYSGEEGFDALVVSYRLTHLEWIPQNKGGGFVADHGEDASCLARCTNKEGVFWTPEGNTIVQTAEYFLLILPKDGSDPRQCVLSMKSTQLKHSRKLNTLMHSYRIPHPKEPNRRIQAPTFYRVYNFATGPEKNDKGNWMGWVVTPGADTLTLENGQQLYLEARSFKQNVAEGKVKVSEPVENKPTEDGKEAF